MIIDEEMLDYVMDNVGECFDFGLCFLKLNQDTFIKQFYSSMTIKRLENGDPRITYGITGIEMCLLVLDEYQVFPKYDLSKYNTSEEKSAEYWIGSTITFYCLSHEVSFNKILTTIQYNDLKKYYIAYHQQDELAIASLFSSLLKKQRSNLKNIREEKKLSQRDLSIVSGVSVRAIQAYEQNYKNINKCEAYTLYKLARALNTSIESLLNL